MARSSVWLGVVGTCCLLAGESRAGMATFSPLNVEVPAGTSILVEVSVAAQILSDVDFAYLVLGSGTADPPVDGAADLSFAISAGWSASFGTSTVAYDAEGVFLQEVSLTGDNDGVPIGQTALNAGTLTIDTTGMANGIYSIAVDQVLSEMALTGEGGGYESIAGSYSFTIVPEPTAGLVLLLAGATLWCSRRNAR